MLDSSVPHYPVFFLNEAGTDLRGRRSRKSNYLPYLYHKEIPDNYLKLKVNDFFFFGFI